MGFYKGLKIKNKLMSGFATLVVFSVVVGYFGYRGISEIKERLDDMYHDQLASLTLLSALDHHSQQHRRAFLHFFIERNQFERQIQAAMVTKEEQQLTELLVELGKQQITPQERSMSAELTSTLQNYLATSLRILKDAQANSDLSSAEAGNEKLYQMFVAVEKHVRELSELNLQQARDHFEQSDSAYTTLRFWLVSLIVVSLLLAMAMAILITRSVVNPLRILMDAVRSQQKIGLERSRLVEAIAAGDLDHEVLIAEPLVVDSWQIGGDEAGYLLQAIVEMSEGQRLLDHAFACMTESLRHSRMDDQQRVWFENGKNELNVILRGDKTTTELTRGVIEFLAEYLGAAVGVCYLYDEREQELIVAARYAVMNGSSVNDHIPLGQNLAGQAALEQKMICLNDAPGGYFTISSGLGQTEPRHVVALPLVYNGSLFGLVELGAVKQFSDQELQFLQQTMEWIAIALNVNCSRHQVNELLEHTQSQAEELRVQQEELQQTNEELEERTQVLEQQREEIRAKNREIESASEKLQQRARDLEQVSTYKSQFLANMSHELRTPLNSMMILSSLLKDNRDGNLTDRQVEFAATINGAGRDLLNLINDILDLSKIEAGKLDFLYETHSISDICSQLQSVFSPVAVDKGIALEFEIDQTAPLEMVGDLQRIQQILKNLLSNACKFTTQGGVVLRIYSPSAGDSGFDFSSVAFSVSDTGIGIPPDKLELVFQAFQQADGSTSRTYGGTGLGLSIARQLARSMGGDIRLKSQPGAGSTFTLYLPVAGVCEVDGTVTGEHRPEPTDHSDKRYSPPHLPPTLPVDPATVPASLPAAPLPDDRDALQDAEKTILIIEDDLAFAKILLEMVRGRGFAGMVAADGESGITLAEYYQPSAIILDVMLPHIDGWGVMHYLKDNPVTRHIPVHFITCLEERQKAMAMGAVGLVTKPVSTEQLDTVFGTLESAIEKTMKMLLIVEDDPAQAQAMVALLEDRNITICVAESGGRAIELLASEAFDCIVLDLGLADMGAFELLEKLKIFDPLRRIPVIIHTGRELTQLEEKRLRHYAESIIIKGAKSPERLLNEVTLFLHLVETSLAPDKQRMIRSALDKEAMLEGKKVLIVDDDMRNIFSLSSALSEKNMNIMEAENGREALRLLDEHPDMDLVLMDIMMPEMDGYEAMRAIRIDPRFHALPIIALTAKAMKGDREECLNAGASDYIPKPVDMEKLLSLLRVWLYQK